MKKKRILAYLLAMVMAITAGTTVSAETDALSVSSSSAADVPGIGTDISPEEAEEQIFRFLMIGMGLNQAAACGVLANIRAESGFDPHAAGDGGAGYGICQWDRNRYRGLLKLCGSIGLSYDSFEGQLKFLEYELLTAYGGVLERLRDVSNTAEGAYKAGYQWCFRYERPADIQRQSSRMGNAAKFYYWERYRDVIPEVQEQTTVFWGVDYADVYQYDYFLKYNEELAGRFEDDPASALEFFVTKGMEEGLVASSEFDLQSYKARYPELRERFGDVDAAVYYRHYMAYGKAEGRDATACVCDGVNYMRVFDFHYYVNTYPDMAVAFRNDSQGALRHFLTRGRLEGKRGRAEDGDRSS